MLVEIVQARCGQVASVLRQIGVPPPVEPGCMRADVVSFDLATLNFGLVAICHQTQRLAGDVNGVVLRGWDYLQARLLQCAEADLSFATGSGLLAVTSARLNEVIAADGQLSREDVERRAALLRECGLALRRWHVESISEIYEQCGRRIGGEAPNLLGHLSEVPAFADPVRKKSLFFLGLNVATCSWKYVDAEALDPPVDYHEVRGHIRLGTVRIVDQALREALANRTPVSETADVQIRKAVTGAIQRISDASGFNPMQLHYAFWNLFRSLCLRGRPRCRAESLASLLPLEYRVMAADDMCCFACCCDSVDRSSALDEHVFLTDWY